MDSWWPMLSGWTPLAAAPGRRQRSGPSSKGRGIGCSKKVWPLLRLLAVAWVGLSGCGSTRGAEASGPIVSDIEIRGADAISEGEIKKRLATRETGWWPLAAKRRFDPIEWQLDLQRIERYYETQGYHQAQVSHAEVVEKGPGRVALQVVVEENQPVRIDTVAVRGLESLGPEQRQQVLEDLPLQAPDIFREQRWLSAKAQIIDRLKEGGHAAAALVGEAKLDLKANRGDLDLLVDAGPRYHFGEVLVSAPEGARVEPALVREQVELALAAGRRYSEEDLEEAQKRVFAMGIFASARVVAGQPDPAAGLVPVLVEVREAPFRTIRLGGGVAIDQVRQEARLVGTWENRDFLGGLRKLGLEGMAGWAFIPSTVAVVRSFPDRACGWPPSSRANEPSSRRTTRSAAAPGWG
jgi:translocation and assembly module TamA